MIIGNINFKIQITIMIRIYLIIVIVFSAFFSYGQEGTIVFNRKYHWVNIASKLPYLSQEEKDRIQLTWGNDTDNKGKIFCSLLTQKAVYIPKKKLKKTTDIHGVKKMISSLGITKQK